MINKSFPRTKKIYALEEFEELSPTLTTAVQSNTNLKAEFSMNSIDHSQYYSNNKQDIYLHLPETLKLIILNLKLQKKQTKNFTQINEGNQIFFGKLILGKKIGYGQQYNKETREYYEGNFFLNLFHGQGTLVKPNGIVQQCLFFAGQPFDEIFYFLKNEFTLENVTQTYPNHAFFQGKLKNNQREGIGKYTWNDGTYYLGEFKNDQFNGIGMMKYYNGDTYYGEWKNGKMDGIGQFQWSKQEDQYIGQYSKDQKNGFGIFKWKDGLIYQGYFKDGKRNGQAIIKLKNYKTSLTYWVDGVKKD